jgi:hypothetical protein
MQSDDWAQVASIGHLSSILRIGPPFGRDEVADTYPLLTVRVQNCLRLSDAEHMTVDRGRIAIDLDNRDIVATGLVSPVRVFDCVVGRKSSQYGHGQYRQNCLVRL